MWRFTIINLLNMKQHLFLLSIVFAFMQAKAEVRLPSIFSAHIVFQQNAPVKVWGWAAPGEKITVELGIP